MTTETTNPNDLITLDDLEALGVDLSSEEDKARAQKWITYASNYLRVIASNNGYDLDEKLNIDDAGGGQYRSVVEMVVANAAIRGFARNLSIPDATQWSQSATPYSESVSMPGGASEAYFKAKELKLLGFYDVSGKSQTSILRGVRG